MTFCDLNQPQVFLVSPSEASGRQVDSFIEEYIYVCEVWEFSLIIESSLLRT